MNTSRDSIVCGIDFTDASERTLAWAAMLARRWEAAIELVHILPPPSTSIEAQATDVRVLESTQFDMAKQRLESTAREIAAKAGLAIHTQVLGGDPPTTICRLAEDVRAKMIVVGSHGRSAMARWVLGSVAERTVRTARVPVAVVPPPADERRDPRLEDARREERPMRVLAGLACDSGDARIVAMVSSIRRLSPCEVVFVHLYWPQEEFVRLGLPGPRDLLAADKDVVANLEPGLRRTIEPLAGEGDAQLVIKPAWGEPGANLLLAAQQYEADLIVVGAEERYGLARIMHPSVVSSLAHRTRNTPVIFVPPQEEETAAAAARPVRTPAYATVLAPTDLSRASNSAVRHAYALLRGRGGVVELCHIHEQGLSNPPHAYSPRFRVTPEDRAEIERQLRTLIPPDAESLGITTHVSVFEGSDAGSAIVQAAERLHVDVVSMGSHGRAGISRALLGSVAEKVVRHAKTPVLVVRVRE